MKLRVCLALLLTLAFAVTTKIAPAVAASPALDHVYVIMEENTNYEDLIGNTADAPYINQLANTYGFAANYYGVTHPSQPNYIALTAGDYFGINKDDPTLTFNQTNIVDQLESKSLTWASYQQGLPSVGFNGVQYPATGSGLYVKKHNPFALFTDVASNPARMQNIKSTDALATDLNSGHAPNFAFIAPDTCHDMHGVSSSSAAAYGMPWCAYPADFTLSHQLIQQADTYLKTLVTTIMSSKGWTANSAIFVTWDENESSGESTPNRGYSSSTGCCGSKPGDGGGRVPMIVITNTPVHTVSLQPYNHYSLLRTVEDNFGMPCLNMACDPTVHAMTDLLTGAGTNVPLAMTQGIAVTFTSLDPGQGEVLFGPSCDALVEVGTNDLGAGTTTHTVLVTGNDLPGTVGNIGLTPGARYAYESVTVTKTGTVIDNNGGQCYYATMSIP
jgi:phosphatidylinositol-3-phosphatase